VLALVVAREPVAVLERVLERAPVSELGLVLVPERVSVMVLALEPVPVLVLVLEQEPAAQVSAPVLAPVQVPVVALLLHNYRLDYSKLWCYGMSYIPAPYRNGQPVMHGTLSKFPRLVYGQL